MGSWIPSLSWAAHRLTHFMANSDSGPIKGKNPAEKLLHLASSVEPTTR